jgi:drug/metabolite transporter (DMT)-like permease
VKGDGPPLNRNARAYLAVSAAVAFWGVSFVATKVALRTIPPCVLLAFRFALASVVLLPLWFVFARERLRRSDFLLFALLGIMEPGLYFVLETRGLLYTSASAASLIMASIPVFVILLARFLLREPLRPRVAAGIFLTLAGVAFLLFRGEPAESLEGSSFRGNLYILGAALCASAYTVVSRRLGARYRPWTVTMVQALVATVFFLPLAVWEWRPLEIRGIGTPEWAALLFLALFATLFAFLCYNYSLSVLEASRVAVFLNVIPLVTVACASWILGERLGPIQAVGGVLILVGVTITTSGAHGAATGGTRPLVGSVHRWLKKLHGGTHHGMSALSAAKKYVKGPASSVAGARRSEGQHKAF